MYELSRQAGHDFLNFSENQFLNCVSHFIAASQGRRHPQFFGHASDQLHIKVTHDIRSVSIEEPDGKPCMKRLITYLL
jgi:hypothetical protein